MSAHERLCDNTLYKFTFTTPDAAVIVAADIVFAFARGRHVSVNVQAPGFLFCFKVCTLPLMHLFVPGPD